jgi:hypothetical protein
MESIISLLLGMTVFLYVLFIIGRDDFLLLRKNIALDQLFSLSLIGSFFVVLGARVGHVIFQFDMVYLNPLVFLAFFYLQGLSFSGGIIAAIIWIAFASRSRKYPFWKLLDVAVICGLYGICVGLLPYALTFGWMIVGLSAWTLCIAVVATWQYAYADIKEGSIGLIGLGIWSFGTALLSQQWQWESTALVVITAVAFLTYLMVLVPRRLFSRTLLR